MSAATSEDRLWLDAAVRYARPYLGTTGGKPLAAVLVVDPRSGVLHSRAVATATAAADVSALAAAGERARGAMLIATMEPASDPVIQAGIRHVVVGVRHPDPGRAGKSNTRLRDAGIDVTLVEHAPSRDLLAPFIMRHTRRRPFVTIILPVSKDGMVGHKDGTSIALGEEAQRWIAAERARGDAIMTHAGSLIELTTTLPPVARWHILDRNGRPETPSALSDLLARDVSALVAVPDAPLLETLVGAGLADRLHLIQTMAELGRDGIPATPLGTLDGRLRGARLTQLSNDLLGPDMLRTYEPEA